LRLLNREQGGTRAQQSARLIVQAQSRLLLVDQAEICFAAIDEGVIRVVTQSVEGQSKCRTLEELLEQLDLSSEQIVFTPHLLPIPRGILSTIYVWFQSPRQAAEVESLYRSFFAESPLVRIFPAGQLPQIQYSVHTNYCDIGFQLAADVRRCVIVSCLDNLLKGAAGQAVQNMNLMSGYPEAEGLL